HDEIKRARLEALLRAGFFEIENLAFHLWKSRQLLQSAGEESRGNVGECVAVQPALEQWQQMRRETGRASPDFENAQPASLRQMAGGFLDRARDRRQPVACEQTVAVKLIEEFRAGSAEQNLHC